MDKAMFFGKKAETAKAENRIHGRVDLFLPTYCTLYNDTKKSSLYECWINNISVGGLALKIKDRDIKDFDCDRVNVIYRVGTHQRNDRLYIRHMDKVLMDWKFGCQFIDDDHKRGHVIRDFFKL
jgi:hypothetical protein